MFIVTKGLFLLWLLQQNHTLITPKERNYVNLILTYFQEMKFDKNPRKLIFSIPEKVLFFGEFVSVFIWKILMGTILQEGDA